eukprot:9497046-Pyramimonas_sp.AAC.2
MAQLDRTKQTRVSYLEPFHLSAAYASSKSSSRLSVDSWLLTFLCNTTIHSLPCRPSSVLREGSLRSTYLVSLGVLRFQEHVFALARSVLLALGVPVGVPHITRGERLDGSPGAFAPGRLGLSVRH